MTKRLMKQLVMVGLLGAAMAVSPAALAQDPSGGAGTTTTTPPATTTPTPDSTESTPTTQGTQAPTEGATGGAGSAGSTASAPAPTGTGGKVTVCHKGTRTLSVGAAALDAHLHHGDTAGPCESGTGGAGDDADPKKKSKP